MKIRIVGNILGSKEEMHENWGGGGKKMRCSLLDTNATKRELDKKLMMTHYIM